MGTLVTHYVPTQNQLANIFIKSLLKDVFPMFQGKLDILIHSCSNLRGVVKGNNQEDTHPKENIKEDTQNQVHKR